MKKAYLKPQLKVVKLHGRPVLNSASPTKTVRGVQSNLGSDSFIFEGEGNDEDALNAR